MCIRDRRYTTGYAYSHMTGHGDTTILDAAVELAAQCGVSSAQLQEMLRILLREEGTHERD